jgi:two-component system LytT family response regulator
MTLKTFSEFEKEISPRVICRIHKSYMVALQKIDSTEKDTVKIGAQILPVSETYKKIFLGLLRGSNIMDVPAKSY